MNLLNAVSDYLETNVQLNARIVGPLLERGSSVAIRLTPSSENVRYIEGFNYNVGFQILVQDSSNVKAMLVMEDIFRALHGINKEHLASDGSFTLIDLRCTTRPNFVEKDSSGVFVYTALFQAEIEY